MTPGYPVLGQGSSIQENWFQNRTQRPRFAIERTPNTIWFRQKQNLVFGVTNPWPLGTQFWVRGHRYRKTGFKIGLSDPDLLWKDTQHDMVSAKTKLGFWGHEPMTPGYPVLGQGSSIQENWFQESDSATPICYRRTPNTIWFRQKQNLVFGVTNPWPSGYPVLGQGSSIEKNWLHNRIQRPWFAMKGHPTRYGSAKRKNFFFLICITSLIS